MKQLQSFISSIWNAGWQVAEPLWRYKIGHKAAAPRANRDSPLRLMEGGTVSEQMMVEAMQQMIISSDAINRGYSEASRAWTLARFHNHGNRNPLAPQKGGRFSS